MAFDWREYLTLARWLQANTPPGMSREGAVRCAIGRAYYAAFGYAIEYATAYLDFSPGNDADDHGRLRAHLRQKRRHKVSEALDRLRGWRNACDYVSVYPGDLAATLTNALDEADYVIRALPPPAPTSKP
jgi:hypothetical protein